MENKRELKFHQIDYWSRPQFIDKHGNFFGCLDKLFQEGSTFEDVTDKESSQYVDEHDICYFGSRDDDDPDGRVIKADKIKLVKEFTDEQDTVSE
jgi:hypothetical protein